MSWPKEDLLLKSVTHSTRTQLLAAFNIDLAMGHSIKGKPIEVNTMKNYTSAAATMVGSAVGRDPRYDNVTDSKMSKSLHAVWSECLRYQKVPNKCDPYSLDMHDTLTQSNNESNAPSNGFLRAFEDWANVNSYLGCRISEWAQEDEYKLLSSGGKHSPLPEQHGLLAFTLANIQCFNKRGTPISVRTFLADRNSVFTVAVTFSWQKNGNHGETRNLQVNACTRDRCAVRSFYNILLRFDQLVGISTCGVPLAVYAHGTTTLFLHRKVIKQVLRKIAKDTYKVNEVELDKHYNFNPHSLRVGACVILHAAGVPGYQIRFLLRWKSDSFMEYLRNVNALSDTQNQAFVNTDSPNIPNLF